MSSRRRARRRLLFAALGAFAATGAQAADLSEPKPFAVDTTPTWFDVSFGVKFSTDYVLRSLTQTAGHPTVQGYTELSLFDWAYFGVWASNVDFSTSRGFSDPAAEVDIYGGLRHTWGAVTLDAGYVYFWFPGEKPGFRQTDFGKVYGKVTYAIGDLGTIGANVFYTNDNINTGARVVHSSLLGKINLPNYTGIQTLGFYASGELGRRWINRNDFGFKGPDYTFWNAGVGATYKAMTLDFRYTDSNLSRNRCALATGVRSWCGDRYLVSMSFDTSLSKLK